MFTLNIQCPLKPMGAYQSSTSVYNGRLCPNSPCHDLTAGPPSNFSSTQGQFGHKKHTRSKIGAKDRTEPLQFIQKSSYPATYFLLKCPFRMLVGAGVVSPTSLSKIDDNIQFSTSIEVNTKRAAKIMANTNK